MGDNFQVLEILVFAVIAAILIFRLRSVLGRRTGNERRRDLPFGRGTPQPGKPVAPAIALPVPRLATATTTQPTDTPLAALLAAEPGFDQNAFLDGARGAFELIVQAFAAGDRTRLRPLLGSDVFASFSTAIGARERAQETQETRIVAIKRAEIVESRVQGTTALVTVKFVSDQIMVTRNAAGAAIDGDAEHAAEHTDLWTFARPVGSSDPNWLLIATDTPQHP